MNAKQFLRDFVDHVGPKLDTYEQAIYLYLIRRSRLEGNEELVVPVESASLRVAVGIAKKGARISRDVFRQKLLTLQAKGFVRVIGKEYRGTRVKCFLPGEVEGAIAAPEPARETDLEAMDFFSVPANREAVFARERHRCFYCLASLTEHNRVIDHVSSLPQRDNSYRNCVAACLSCNSEKGADVGEDFLRVLYRKGRLRAEELDSRIQLLRRIQEGLEKPEFTSG